MTWTRADWLKWLRQTLGQGDSEVEIASLRASLDDAHREISRLTGEKHKRDSVIHAAIETLQSLHRQGKQG